MANTTITGSYPSGYLFNTPNATLTNKGSVGGTGLSLLATADTLVNAGQITGSSAGVYLAQYPGEAVINQLGANISSPSIGVQSGGVATVTNAGAITGGAVYGNYGVFLNAGSLIINEAHGTISGYRAIGLGFGYTDPSSTFINPPVTIVNDGVIAGSTAVAAFSSGAGVLLSAGGTLTNNFDGVITGGVGVVNREAPATVVNAGRIAGSTVSVNGYGVELSAGGSVTNQGTGIIIGYTGIHIAPGTGNNTVVNDGLIRGTGTTTDGVFLDGNGSITNRTHGTITGKAGIDINGVGTIANYGLIAGSTAAGPGIFDAGARLNAGGSFTNFLGASVTAGTTGVLIQGSPGTLINDGRIAANIGSGEGVEIELGGAVTNQAGGTISGDIGVYVMHYGGASTLVNAGTIIGGAGGEAVQFQQGATAERLVIDPGAVFNGIVDGGNTITSFPFGVSTLELASGASAGIIAGLSFNYINFGAVTIDAGASWIFGGDNILLSGATLSAGSGGSATLASGATLDAVGKVLSGTRIDFGSNSGVLQVSPLSIQFAGTIGGMTTGDTIIVSGITNATTATLGIGNILAVSRSVGAAIDLQMDPTQNFNGAVFSVATVNGSTDVTETACFAAGTRIMTEHGDAAIETLRVGDRVRTLLGGSLQPVVWIGKRVVDCRRHPKPHLVWPVRVAGGAFGPARPHRELFLSPDHAVYVNDVLIPIKCLINGHSVRQVPVDTVAYYHLELARHDILLAEGLPAESFLDMKDGSNYANRLGPVRLVPDYAARMWEAFGCAPLIVTGPALQAARALVENFANEQQAA